MNQTTNFTIPEINGEFNNWCGNCWQMEDNDGDNVWEFTTLVDTSLQEYKFSADNWNIQESLDSSSSCVMTTIDSVGNVFVNRYLHISSDTVILMLFVGKNVKIVILLQILGIVVAMVVI